MGRNRRSRRRAGAWACAVLAVAWLGASAAPARAMDYDPQQAGHPLRVIAYVLNPIGVALDYLIFRPAYWLGTKEPLRTIFGVEYGLEDGDPAPAPQGPTPGSAAPTPGQHPPPPAHEQKN